jgi:hypothetical protein
MMPILTRSFRALPVHFHRPLVELSVALLKLPWRVFPALGPGVAYRAVAALQRDYFSPPADHRASWDVMHEPRVSKLISAPPIEHHRDRRRTRFKLTVDR